MDSREMIARLRKGGILKRQAADMLDFYRGEVDRLDADWDEASRHSGRLMAERDALKAEVATLRERLEIGFAFDSAGNRVEISDAMLDGISARDETIRLQDEQIDRLRRKIRKLKRKLRESARTAKAWADAAMGAEEPLRRADGMPPQEGDLCVVRGGRVVAEPLLLALGEDR